LSLQKNPLAVEHALLGLVRTRPMHGYELYQLLCAPGSLGQVWRVKQGLLYALLKRLEQEGLLAGQRVDQDDAPARRVLAITPAGAAAFDRWLMTPVASGRDLRIEFLAKLFFAQQQGKAAVDALIDRQLAAVTAWRRQLEQRRAALSPAATFDQLVLDYRIGQVQAAASWLATCSARVHALASIP
jgi:PadR family transcriptional regulator AphA